MRKSCTHTAIACIIWSLERECVCFVCDFCHQVCPVETELRNQLPPGSKIPRHRMRVEAEVEDAPLCCCSFTGVGGKHFLAVGDCGGALSIYCIIPVQEEGGSTLRMDGSHMTASARDPLRAELVCRLRGAHTDMLTNCKHDQATHRLGVTSRDGTLTIYSTVNLEERLPFLKPVCCFGQPVAGTPARYTSLPYIQVAKYCAIFPSASQVRLHAPCAES